MVTFVFASDSNGESSLTNADSGRSQSDPLSSGRGKDLSGMRGISSPSGGMGKGLGMSDGFSGFGGRTGLLCASAKTI